MAKRQVRGRPLDGILLLDKPQGLTSNQALQTVKGIYFAQKAGHTGSLDPLATGMLPLCFGEATKFSQFLLDADKEYLVTAQLGVQTNTCDSEGEIINEKDASGVTLALLNTALENFRGVIQQIPSMFSALKHNGQPLYKLARQGIEIERQARPVTIYHLELLTFDAITARFSLRVKCSKGTYIRNLIDDIGATLGCGAHVTVLRRISVAGFTEQQMITLPQLEQLRDVRAFVELDEFILPLQTLANDMATVELTSSAAFQVQHGQAIELSAVAPNDFVKLVCDNQFIGIGAIDNEGRLVAKRIIKQ